MRTHYFIAAMMLALPACDAFKISDNTPPQESIVRHHMKSLDERFADIAQAVPGFAGAWLDADRVVTIGLVNDANREAARAAIAEFMRSKAIGRRQGVRPETFRFVSAKFAFDQLKSWYDEVVNPLFENANVIMTDIDEKANTIDVGVASVQLVDQYRSLFLARGIPEAAVRVFTMQAPPMTTTLNDHTDTIRAGWAIRAYRSNGWTGPCTAGANVRFAGSSTTYLMTAAHCGLQLALDSGYASQPDSVVKSPTAFGVERYEGTGWEVVPATDSSYHYIADVSLYDYSVALTPGFPDIQGVTGYNSKTIDNSHTYTINDVEYYPWVGELVDKIGAKSGLTAGEVSNTCRNMTFTNSWFGYPSYQDTIHKYVKINCLVQTTFGGVGGDSGGAAYYVATFFGIVTASGFFNPLTQIQSALDSLVYF